jgi:hypothetical protein
VSRARVLTAGGCGDWEDFVAEDADGAVLEDMDMFACCPTPAFAFAHFKHLHLPILSICICQF